MQSSSAVSEGRCWKPFKEKLISFTFPNHYSNHYRNTKTQSIIPKTFSLTELSIDFLMKEVLHYCKITFPKNNQSDFELNILQKKTIRYSTQ